MNTKKPIQGKFYNHIIKTWEVKNSKRALECKKQGLRIYSISQSGYCIGYPSISLLDLSDTTLLQNYGLKKLLAVWENLNENITEYKEIASKYDTELFKLFDFWFVLGNNKRPILTKVRKEILSKIIKKLGLDKSNKKKNYKAFTDRKINYEKGPHIQIYRQYKDQYLHHIESKYKEFCKLYNVEYIKKGKIWHEISILAKHKVFIAHSGCKYALGYLSEGIDDNVLLIEIHLDVDPFWSCRNKPIEEVLLSHKYSKIPGEDLIIIDKAGTGATLKHAKKILGGNAKTLGLFPKTWESLQNLDYFVFLDHLFSNNDIQRLKLKPDSWYLDLIIHLTNNSNGKK
ncbi:hypothetical protein GF362_00020 [Candidatus Dojkabacteria bacterium]|nr:hypothetical protein [Candidatus Dojkabacteria bacterium]